MRKILITGGGGFIGRHIAETLSKDNDVTIVDTFETNPQAAVFLEAHGIEVVRLSVVQEDFQTILTRNFDVVIHAAAIAGVESVVSHPFRSIETNLLGAFNLLGGVSALGSPPRLILFSTSEVYGPLSYQSVETDSTVIGPATSARWNYAAAKVAMEHVALAAYTEFGLKSYVVRPFNVFGPGQSHGGGIARFVQAAKSGQKLEVYGEGTDIRAWCFIDDFVRAICQIVELETSRPEILNIGNPYNSVSARQLAEKIVDVLDSPSEIVHVPELPAKIDVRIPDISRARDFLDWFPTVDLIDGIRRTANGAEPQGS